MATIYLRSTDGSDVDDGSTWALAKATLAAALTAAGAGGTVYVSQAHAESVAAAISLVSPGTAASPVRVLCVNDAAEPPTALATGGSVTTQSGAASRNITFTGFAYYYGMSFVIGTAGANVGSVIWGTASAWFFRFDECVFHLNNSSGSSTFTIGNSSKGSTLDQLGEFVGCDFLFGNTAQRILAHGEFVMRDCRMAPSGTVPLGLFGNATSPGVFEMIGCDLSTLGSAAIIDAAPADPRFFRLRNCKLGASYAMATGAVAGQGGTQIDAINCDSEDTNYIYYKQRYQGTITQETTIVRTTPTGATDGTTPVSRKMVTTANSKFYSPLVSDPIEFWNETTGSNVTVTIAVVTDNVTLTNAEAWVEVEYLGTSGFPLGNFADDRAADILAAPANQTTDATSTWTTTGLTTPVKQELSVTFTPQEKGLIRARVCLAKASTTMYFDPLAITGARQFQTSESFQNQPATGSPRATLY